MNNESEEIASAIIIRNFDLIFKEDDLKIEAVKKYLKEKISELIDTNREKLFSILYRIDLKEESVMDVMACSDASERLADLIIERQIEKAKMRIEYSKGSK